MSQSRFFCEVHRRAAGGFMTDLLVGNETSLSIRSIPVEAPLAEIYEGGQLGELLPGE